MLILGVLDHKTQSNSNFEFAFSNFGLGGFLKNERGYITMAALWISAILMVVSAGLTVYVKLQQRAVKNYEFRVKAFYVAKAGANTMVFETNRAQTRYSNLVGINSLNSGKKDVKFGEGAYTATIEDEKSKANINTASEFLMRRMFEELGLKDAATKARGVMKWRREHGLLLHVEELGLVPELDVDDCFKIIPYFTVYSIGTPGSASLNVNTASLIVLKTQIEEFNGPATLTPQLMQKRPFRDRSVWTFISTRAPRMAQPNVNYFTYSAPVFRVRCTATLNDTIKVTINTVVENWLDKHEIIYIMDWWEE